MRTSLPFLCAACLGLTACSRPKSPGYQGYLEGEFVYVGAPLGERFVLRKSSALARADVAAVFSALKLLLPPKG